MIIYNNNKDFLGIDKESLKSLGFSNLIDLQSEAADFGDLFVKTPGYVHNFKHVHWIDFVLCEEDKNACKAIIHTSSGNFHCILEIKTIYLTSSPNSKSYIINLNNLRILSSSETSDISNELQTRDIPITTIAKNKEPQKIEQEIKIEEPAQIVEPVKKTVIDDPYENDNDISLDNELSQEQLDAIGEADVSITEINLDETDDIKEKVVKESSFDINEESKNVGFDIEKTAEILEMDVATIKDFVNDFIIQSKEFKNKLYDSIIQKDLIVLKGLSHQLKGVAANLRIYDCQDILIKINKASDFTTSKADLDTFYNLIAKLSAEKVSDEKPKIDEPIIDEPIINEVEDEYILEIDDTLSTETKDKNKTNSLEIEEPDDLANIDDIEIDDYILEIDDKIISADTNNKVDNTKKQEELIEEQNIVDELKIEFNTQESTDAKVNEEKLNIDETNDEVKNLEETDFPLEELKSDPVKTYNKVIIANEIGLDEESFNELFQDYAQESQNLVSIIQKAIDDDDLINWRYSAIKLKGMSDNMRIDNFTSELETIISTNDKDNAQKALEELKSSLSNTILTKD